MKRFTAALALALLLPVMGESAYAQRHRPPPPPVRGHVHVHGGDWLAPLIFLGVAGAMIGAATQPPPAPVYVCRHRSISRRLW